MAGWEFWIDRGGTFTDVVARSPQGKIHVEKLLSDNPDQYKDAPLHAMRTLLGLEANAAIPKEQIHSIKMATTLATNALLQRKGERVGLLITKGFGDLLEIGYQDRPELFTFHIQKTATLSSRVIEIDERIMADGTIRKGLDEDEVASALESLRSDGIDAVAIVLIHGFAFPIHEHRIGALARTMGFDQISLSHEVAPEIKVVGRGDTTVADAYLTPILREYIGRLRSHLDPDTPLRFMQSNGGLTNATSFSGKNAILSGPAGGVVAFAHIGKMAGFDKTIGFDMGGTSTDVSRFDGTFERVYETQVAGVRLKAPMLAIETVAAGGGSILQFEDGRFMVGPESAGAFPGPACYRNGGPATVTDANVVLGRVHPDYFPACFGPHGDEKLNVDAARDAIDGLRIQVEAHTKGVWSIDAVAAGFIRVANENMAKPIKEISVARGYDVQEYALVTFGGAGAQHACAVADSLGMESVLIHPYAGVLSAYGMGLADSRATQSASVLTTLSDSALEDLNTTFIEMEEVGETQLSEEGFRSNEIEHLRTLDLRYLGVEAYLNVPAGTLREVVSEFERVHRQLYGFLQHDTPIEIVNARVESIGETTKPTETIHELKNTTLDASSAITTVEAWNAGRESMQSTPLYQRNQLVPGMTVHGPALLVESVSTIVIDPGWSAVVNEFGHLILTGQESRNGTLPSTAECDPVLLEIFNNLFMSVATQMGETLERVSHSANIKERLDFSCAIFDQHGDLIANAPHIPVHLGAMSESVRAIIDECDTMHPGEVYVTNDPFHGGSHLPDITVVSPVFMDDSAPAFFVASRGHHADIGGVAPGSMPPFSTSIQEEGILIHNFMLVSDDVFHEEEIVALLSAGPYPARNISERLSDLRAQVAANKAGEELLQKLCASYSTEVVHSYMGHVRENAAETMRACIEGLNDGVYEAVDSLDNGARIRCAITIQGVNASVDFSGTDGQLNGNLNAPEAVVKAAVLYFVRCLIDKPIPLNAGCLDPITITIPEGSLLSPKTPAAVVGGNVETSNRVVDVLGAALGVVAGSQGTMNNFTFGTEEFGYYETICGGCGAGPEFDGASALHSHMTNTRITDPEVLERRYPVLLREFSIRKKSGGNGEHRGGDGVVRRVEFLEPAEVGILSERRTTQPYSVGAAEPGKSGQNWVHSVDTKTKLPGHATIRVQKGDQISLETPGGGGYSRDSDAKNE